MELCNYMIVAYKVLKARVSAPEHYCSTRLSSDKCYEKTKFTHYPYRERMSKAGILQKLLLPACTTTAVTCDLRALSRRQRRRRTYWRASCTVAKREWLLIFSGTKSSKRIDSPEEVHHHLVRVQLATGLLHRRFSCTLERSIRFGGGSS